MGLEVLYSSHSNPEEKSSPPISFNKIIFTFQPLAGKISLLTLPNRT
jgi:hypothetical protein